MPKIRRYFLRDKERKSLSDDFSRAFKTDAEHLIGSKPRIEVIETLRHKIFLINSKPIFASHEENLFPTLVASEILLTLPRILVDMGAVPNICKGADVMAPGIVDIHGNFKEKQLIVIVDEKYGKPIAIGLSLFASEYIKTLKEGRTLKNLHHVGDEIWNTLKNLVQGEKIFQ